MTEPIRVLQVVASLNAGGMENYIMNLYRMVDKSKVQFDFVVHHAAVGLYEDEIQELGGKIYHFTVLDDKNVVKYISELNRFFDEHKEYQIIHGHLSSLAVFYLGVAKKYNVPWRIAHSHGAGFLHTLKGTAKYLLFRTTKWNANVRLACSTEAGKYLYGKDTFEFVPNATAFSLNFNKEFVIVYPGKYSTRLQSILEILGLTNRVAKNERDLSIVESKIDYNRVNEILAAERKRSLLWLSNALSGVKNERYANNPILEKSNEKYDQCKVGGCDILKENDRYYMFYIGYQNVDTARVCMAESNDGIHNWVRSMDNPVISPEKKSWDADAVYKPTVVLNKQKNKLLMWYNGRKQNCERIGLAEYRIK